MTWKLKLKEKPYKLLQGDCIEVMKTLPENSVDAVICDPPYAIGFMGKEFDTFKSNRHYMKFSRRWAKQALRVLKPGGYLLAFSGTRTYHYAAVGIEEAGFECRDMISWVYGSGMPKSYNVSKGIDKMKGAKRKIIGKRQHPTLKDKSKVDREHSTQFHATNAIKDEWEITVPATPEAEHWNGYGTNLKPCQEPIAVFQKPISEGTIAKNCLKWGTGAINIDAGRIQAGEKLGRHNKVGKTSTLFDVNRKDHSTDESVYVDNSSNKGRWPGNIVHDGSPEVLACFPFSKSGAMTREQQSKGGFAGTLGIYGTGKAGGYGNYEASSGSAGRFFYCVKVSNREREEGLENWTKIQSSFWQTGNGASGKPSSIEQNRKARAPRANDHPTVKPVDLMRYLASVYCPHNGIVLDPFMGSGSTGIACIKAGKGFIGIEKDCGYYRIAHKRVNHHYFYR